MNTTVNPVLEIRRIFEASPQRVFDAWLIREEWQRWIGPEGVQCEVPVLEPHVGGKYRIVMQMSDGRVVPVAGEFQVVERPASGSDGKFVFTWGWEGDAARSSVVTILLKDISADDGAGKTELTLRQEGLPSEDDRIGHGKGWNSTLNKLAAFVKG